MPYLLIRMSSLNSPILFSVFTAVVYESRWMIEERSFDKENDIKRNHVTFSAQCSEKIV